MSHTRVIPYVCIGAALLFVAACKSPPRLGSLSENSLPDPVAASLSKRSSPVTSLAPQTTPAHTASHSEVAAAEPTNPAEIPSQQAAFQAAESPAISPTSSANSAGSIVTGPQDSETDLVSAYADPIPPIAVTTTAAVTTLVSAQSPASPTGPTDPVGPTTIRTQPTADNIIPATTTVGNSVDTPNCRLQIAGVRVNRGPVKIAIFTTANDFPNPASASQTIVLASTQAEIAAPLNVSGTFAVAVFQDINSDGQLNRSSFGIPVEPFAFSNNAMGRRGPPSFEQAMIVAPTNSTSPTDVIVNLP